jgi:hypothetical protein
MGLLSLFHANAAGLTDIRCAREIRVEAAILGELAALIDADDVTNKFEGLVPTPGNAALNGGALGSRLGSLSPSMHYGRRLSSYWSFIGSVSCL